MLTADGFDEVTLQIGNSEMQPVVEDVSFIKLDFYHFKPSISEDIHNADLVISHAGLYPSILIPYGHDNASAPVTL